jgi:hypothetical protein
MSYWVSARHTLISIFTWCPTTRIPWWILDPVDADQSSEIEMYRQIHGDLFNMPQLFLGGVKIQIKFMKVKSDFYILSSKSDARAVLKFSDATMYVKHVNLSPRIQLWQRRTPDQI